MKEKEIFLLGHKVRKTSNRLVSLEYAWIYKKKNEQETVSSTTRFATSSS